MNKQKIIAIYQELLASINSIKNSGKSLSTGEALQLAQIEEITAELKEKAEAAGFGEELIADNTVAVNSSDDLFQLINTSACSADIRSKLTKLVGNNYVADGLSRKKLWDALQILDKFYIANVETVSAVTVNSRMKGDWVAIFGSDKYELDLLATAYQNSAKEALFKEITKLSPNNWNTSIESLDASFQDFFKAKKSWLDSADDIKNAASQLKIDLHEFPLIPDSFKTKFFNFTGGKMQVSGKLALKSPITIINQEKALNGFLVDFEQVMKSTISLKAFKGIMPSSGGGAAVTALSKGLTLDLGYVSLTVKADLGKLGFQPGAGDKDEPLDSFFQKARNRTKFTGMSVRFQAAVNLLKIANDSTEINLPGVDLEACAISISGGFNVSLNPVKVKVKSSSSKPDPDVDKPSIEKDNKRLRDIQEKNKHLTTKADALTDAVDKKDMNRLKNAAEEFKETAQEAYELLDNHDWNDKSLKNKAADLLNETAEKVYKKVAGPIGKLTKALKYAKPLARLVPGINAILTVIEVGTFIYDFAVWFNNVDANTWEDYFIAFGEEMHNGILGQWFQSFDRYMKS